MQQRSADLINRLDRQMRHHTKYIAENPENLQGRPSALPEKDARKIFKLLGVTITHLQEVSWGRSVLRTFRLWKAKVRAQNKQKHETQRLVEEQRKQQRTLQQQKKENSTAELAHQR